jgi:hypothetical protein
LWPWQAWDKRRVVAEVNVDFSELFGVDSRSAFGLLIGGMAVLVFFTAGMLSLYRYLRKKRPGFLKRLGWKRYMVVSFMFWSMIGITLKIILRLSLNIKYIWVTPWFNI